MKAAFKLKSKPEFEGVSVDMTPEEAFMLACILGGMTGNEMCTHGQRGFVHINGYTQICSVNTHGSDYKNDFNKFGADLYCIIERQLREVKKQCEQ